MKAREERAPQMPEMERDGKGAPGRRWCPRRPSFLTCLRACEQVSDPFKTFPARNGEYNALDDEVCLLGSGCRVSGLKEFMVYGFCNTLDSQVRVPRCILHRRAAQVPRGFV